MQEVFDPLSIEDLKEKKTLNGIKAEIQDSSWIHTEKNATSEIEERIANKKGRFPCKYCNQTFSKSIYAISHEKKSCKKSKFNQTKTKIMEEVFDPFMNQNEDQKEYETLNEIKKEIQNSNWDQTKKKVSCEIKDRVANKSGRFPCKYCNQTFSKSIYAISHEKKSCKKSKSNQTKNKRKKCMIHLQTRQQTKLWTRFLIHY